MNVVTSAHFGGNLLFRHDDIQPGTPYREMLDEISFHNFRYPGGGIAEVPSWSNGGLDGIFQPLSLSESEQGTEEDIITIREALEFVTESGTTISIVIPTFPFFDSNTQSFDHAGFDRYIDNLESALKEFPEVKISGFEIGNEYWAEITAKEYGYIANIEIPILENLNHRLKEEFGEDWIPIDTGIQAGAAWRNTNVEETHEIADQIDVENREIVDTIYQHAYPNPHRQLEWQKDGAVEPMEAFYNIEGFSDDLNFSFSEFNIWHMAGEAPVFGVNQAGFWIEEFSRYIDAGADSFDHWGINYKWLTTKLYDAKILPSEMKDGDTVTIATPTGKVYDIASTQLIGKSTIPDQQALKVIDVDGELGITGFEDDNQKVIFLSNMSGKDVNIDFSSLSDSYHISTHHIIAADAPYSTWYDESEFTYTGEVPLDARGDMQVLSGSEAGSRLLLGNNELVTLIASESSSDIVLEGAHNVTDPRTGMVDDYLEGVNGNDILRGHVGDDELHGGHGSDVLIGGENNDKLSGGGGGDVLISSTGEDHLSGDQGDDLILVVGKTSDDVVTVSAGTGQDLIVTDGARNIDITDFEDGDMLGFGGAFTSGEELMAATTIEGEDLLIALPDGGILTIAGGADFASDIADRSFDFISDADASETLDSVLSDLNWEQYDEIGTAFRDAAESHLHDPELWNEAFDNFEASHPKPLPTLSESTDPEDPDPEPWQPETEEEPEDEDTDQAGEACFVATAAYGDPYHPDVVALRAFRDLHLSRYRLGRAFIRFYWRVGPKLASMTKPPSIHGRVCRYIINGIVVMLQKRNLTG
ncbi:calcium-binding protein [Paracoccus saliphilus]|uniref:Hemolysin-type calcium-binding repeat-containing protein n=2 Tax=Paracoccus saliphilus TaxID=405559 RepID=A0ABY7S586_9RHOB|nr:calcium-binding protein [Paracoccus saliphilus]WCR02235.1 hypothetical protein JHX88_15225 [Paracoccus saliphilus]